MQSLKSLSHFSLKTPFLLSYFSTLSALPNPLIVQYLTNTFNFSKTKSEQFSSRFSYLKTLDKPKAVVQYLRNLGFSDKQIESTVRASPQILLYDINKTLNPKFEVFQQLGFHGSHLGKFVSKASKILTCSVDRKLLPSIQILKNILGIDENSSSKELLKVVNSNYWLLCVDLDSKLLRNVRLLESYGIVGDQLAMLLRRQPRLLTRGEAAIRRFVLKVTEIGFVMNSRMFVHALIAASSTSVETFEKKFEVFKSFGFSKDEYTEMVKKLPNLLNNSMKKSSIGLDFYLNKVKLRKEELMCYPAVLMYSMEKRVVPRYQVLQIIESKQLTEKKINFLGSLQLSEALFLEKFIRKFQYHEEELVMAYKGDGLDRSSPIKMSAS